MSMDSAHTAPAHQPASIPPRPRHGSGLIAKILTILYALVAAPLGLAMLAWSSVLHSRIRTMQFLWDDQLGSILGTPEGVRMLVALGASILLLVGIVATGMASSAGLILCGAMGAGAVLLAALPSLLFELYRFVPPGPLTELLLSLPYAQAVLLLPLLGGLGIGLAIARRRPDPSVVLSVLGLVLVPLVLVGATALLLTGYAQAMISVIMQMRIDFDLESALLCVLGAVLLAAGAAATRWSPYALLLPALVVLGTTIGLHVVGLSVVPPALWSDPAGNTLISFLTTGGGFVLSAILFLHTIVLAVVRSRSRRRTRLAGASAWDDASPAAA